jgi:hypothetical protein
VRSAGALPSTDDLESHFLEGMACSRDDDRFRNIMERGSLSWFPSTKFPTTG